MKHSIILATLLGFVSAQSDISTQCKTTAATTSGTAAGAYCATPFYVNYTMYYEAIDNGNGGRWCPVSVAQRNRTQPDMDYWAQAECLYVRCWVNGSTHQDIPAGTPCVFPYLQQNVLRRGCLVDSQWNEEPWCPVEVDEDGNYAYGMYGTCQCVDSSIAPPPPPPPTSPTSPGDTPAPTPKPHLDDDDDATSGPQASGGNTGAIFAGIGGTVAGIAVIVLLFVVYRRARMFKGDFSKDLASPRRFRYNPNKDSNRHNRYESSQNERQGLLSAKNDTAYDDSFMSDDTEFMNSTLPVTDLVEDVVPVLAPQTTPPRPTPVRVSAKNVKPSNHQQRPVDPIPVFSQEIGPSPEEIDWAAMEEAAAKLRTCRIVKADGEKIGMRLLNYLGPNFAGVKIVGVHPDSPAAKGGVKEGDSIVEINNAPIINLYHQEVIELLASSGKSFDIIVCRD